MAKFDKEGGGKKRTIITLLIIVLVILAFVGGYFLYKNYSDKKVNQALVTGYGVGYNQSLQDVAQGQSQSGTILVWQNNSIQIISIQDICNRLAVGP
jgi:hypothetical protein